MAVTIQQIAEAAGVSRGTVDRALNNRGRINPQVAEEIRKTAEELGYVPKQRRKKKEGNIKIGVVTLLAKSSFMLEVSRGIRDAAGQLKDRGIELVLKECLAVDENEQLTAIEALEAEGIDGLALMPVDCEGIRVKINHMIEQKNIPVITFNSDIVGTARSCFVGMDNRKSGRAAAGLMGMLTQGRGKVLVITGYFGNNVNNTRVGGFVEELKASYPNLELAGVQGSFDNADEVEKIVVSTIQTIPSINGIFMVSGGQQGLERAYQKLGLEKRPYTIIYDLTPRNRRLLRQGVADFLIDQNGYVQGQQPPILLADMLTKKLKIEEEYRYTDIDIKTKHTLPEEEL